ncbi:MAG TPA: DNA-binding protein WhiA [Clostridiales bacterium]|nr:DNA-binding protein WhiA [Clostridiales bacterium]HPV02554.1 DNA-binding protein WhiA [Clostridiales bacterium]
MSFSSSVKSELCRLENIEACCVLSELAAVVWLNGAAAPVPGDGFNIRITTENAAFARWIYSSIRKYCGVIPEVTIRRSRKLKKHATYMLFLTSASGSGILMEKTGITAVSDGDRCELMLTRKTDQEQACCIKAFLRGAFLAGGSISDPEKTYHLELTSRTSEQAGEIRRLMGFYGLNGRTIIRKGSYVTYLKEGENIVDFLNVIGAHRALMELENVRILKGMRNNVNRIVNCETANLGKTVNASVRQVENILYIAENIGLDKLPPSLREIAELRLEHKDLSLTELGQMLSPPLGKSGVNHRLRKLDRIAEKHRGGPPELKDGDNGEEI